MSSSLEAIEGPATGAILTTYTIDLAFIDYWVLPLLARAGVRNVVVLADEQTTADQIAFAEQSRAGRAYHLGIVRCPGAFHPKIIYLAGSDAQRAAVSSANLTTAGQLRNLETGALLTSDHDEHLDALHDVRSFLGQLAEGQPAHIVEAMTAVLSHGKSGEADRVSNIGFVHNLHRPIAEQLPAGPKSGIAPFVRKRAVAHLLAEAPLKVFIDARDSDSIDDVSGLEEHTTIIRFSDANGGLIGQRLHGKALWNTESRWCLVGSPNLTAPALLREASGGNVEAAVLFSDYDAFSIPPFEVVPRPESASALSDAPVGDETAVPERLTIFSAFFDDGLIVEGLPDGTRVDHAGDLGWEPFGVVVEGTLPIDDDDEVPARLRATLADGTFAFAVVHRLVALRLRRRSRGTAASQVIDSVPLDIQGIRLLESALGDLYALDSLLSEAREKGAVAAAAEGHANPPDSASTSLRAWRPARDHDEPRIPDLYAESFSGDPDVLLAMVRAALRLDKDAPPKQTSTEDNEELDEEGADRDATSVDARPPLTTSGLVNRYRSSLLKVLDRGATKLRTMEDETTRDLTFQTVMSFYAKLGEFRVRLERDEAHKLRYFQAADADGTVEIPLLDPKDLISPRFRLIDNFVRPSDDIDIECRPTLLVHLAAALCYRESLSEIEHRRLDKICYQLAPGLLDSTEPEAGVLSWVTPDLCRALLDEFVQRSRWEGVVEHARLEGWIDGATVATSPYPMIGGSAAFGSSNKSPAWKLIGYGSVAGYADTNPFGAGVLNEGETGPYKLHILKVEPTDRAIRGDRIHEVLWRRNDGKWLTRTWDGYDRQSGDGLTEIVGVGRILESLGSTDFEESEWKPKIAREFFAARESTMQPVKAAQ